jgi:hypothetical protein
VNGFNACGDGILYGAMIASLIPVLMQWWTLPSALVMRPPEVPGALAWALVLMAVGRCRCPACAICTPPYELPHGGWPWRDPSTAVSSAVFVAAAMYNILWGLWSIADPQWLFRFTGMPLANHPAVFACLGMVVGLYGVLYFEVARDPERGWLIGGGRTRRQDPRADRNVLADLERRLARVGGRPCASRTISSGGFRLACTCVTRGLLRPTDPHDPLTYLTY